MQSPEDLQDCMHAFDQVIARLEAAASAPLTGPPRRLCMQAFEENPEGFRRCAERALQRARRNPVGLLVRMVRDRDYLLAAGPREKPQRSELERSLQWAEATGRLIPADDVPVFLDTYYPGLSESERAQAVRAAITRSPDEAAA
jgi:hypothetical protein